MSAAAFDILPAKPPSTGPVPACQPLPGSAPAAAQAPAAGPAPSAPPDAATQLARSNLPGLINSKVPFLISAADLDPHAIIPFGETLKDQLCKAGHCPTYLVFKDHSHISEVMSPNTVDDSVTGPILKWIKDVK